MFARDVVQGHVRACVPSCTFLCVVFVLLCVFRLNTSPPPGAVGVATFHPRYLSFPRLTLRHADGPREVFGMISPLHQCLCSPPYRRGLASPWCSFCGWFAAEPFLPPPATPRYAAGSRAFSAPPPRHTGGTRHVFGGWLLPCRRVCASFNCFFSHVPGSIARPLEVWE